MFKLIPVAVLAVASLALAADPTAKLTKINETREVTFEKSDFMSFPSGLTLTVRVSGQDADNATKYGAIKFTSATDDAGTDLTKKPKDAADFGSSDEFKEIQRLDMQMDDKPKKKNGFTFDLTLPTIPARKAAKLKSVAGEFQILTGGSPKEITVKNLQSQFGKPIEDAALKSAGLSIVFLDPKAKNNLNFNSDENTVNAEITGPRDQLADVEILDSKGEKINNGHFGSEMDGKQSIGYLLSAPLPKNAQAKIKLIVGQKKVTVPFKFENVTLP